ncbi:MAG: class I SAM-dependent methyltransferase [Rhodobacteraceae bacterium]|nr:class I SAM-dependent methyltransferase [Paracoccaceae bacterium]
MEGDGSRLKRAYALRSPEECLQLYADWAGSYDAEFAAAQGYVLPVRVAEAFMAAGSPAGAVLDVGAGTGLVAQALKGCGFAGAIDGLDISAEMLAVARGKGVYRALQVADVTKPLPARCGPYAGIVSAGTFTHGHVGPEGLPPLMDVAAPGAVMVLSVNLGVWEAKGFPAALEALGARIAEVAHLDVPIYGAAGGGDGGQARLLRVLLR